MNKKIYLHLLAAAIAVLTLLPSCEDAFGDFLDKKPSNELTEEQVFSNWANTRYYFYDIYNFLRNGRSRINGSWLDSATDLATTSFSWGGTRNSFNIGNFYSGAGAPEIVDTWFHYYRAIRKCNTLLEKIDQVPLAADEIPALREAQVRRMKAEARSLRAYFYWELALRYGAVPIVTRRLNPHDPGLINIQRPASEGEVFQFVLNELRDSFADLFDEGTMSAENLGRFTQGANLALQSRILLYMASPKYAHLGIASWQDAADAAQLFIQNFGEGRHYRLLTDSDPVRAYQRAITLRVQDSNPEVIFWRNDDRSDWLPNESPVGFGGRGGLTPSLNLVDMYDMANGLSPFIGYDATGAPLYVNNIPTVNVASGYDENNPFANRDPRFHATILYHGAMWWGRPIDVTLGGPDNPVGNTDATPTGFYNRKFMDDSQTHFRTGGLMFRNWIFIRYAEILLNYAEALNEVAGPVPAVFSTMQRLRDRVGLTADLRLRPELNTREGMRNFIRKERTVELAFEGHRPWDVRRWNLAVEALSRPILGITAERLPGGQTRFTREVVQQRVFEPKMYLYPIPEMEIWRTGMPNNPGWE